jgi:hypothetical protein
MHTCNVYRATKHAQTVQHTLIKEEMKRLVKERSRVKWHSNICRIHSFQRGIQQEASRIIAF